MNKLVVRFLLLTILMYCTNQSFSQAILVERVILKIIKKTAKKAPIPHPTPSRTLNKLPNYYKHNPYSAERIYSIGENPNYRNEFLSNRPSVINDNSTSMRSYSTIHTNTIKTPETRRISRTQNFLREKGDIKSVKTSKKYHPESIILRREKWLAANTKEEVIMSQHNLKRLGYYKGKIDGVNGPKSQKAMQQFKNEYNLNNSNFRILNESENTVKGNIEKGDDFIDYWKTKSNNIKQKCTPTLCLHNDKITISLDFNGVSIELSTKSEISVSFSNEKYTYTKKYNDDLDDETQNQEDCDIEWKVCLSKQPDISIDICNYSFNTSSGSFKISTSEGPFSKTEQIW